MRASAEIYEKNRRIHKFKLNGENVMNHFVVNRANLLAYLLHFFPFLAKKIQSKSNEQMTIQFDSASSFALFGCAEWKIVNDFMIKFYFHSLLKHNSFLYTYSLVNEMSGFVSS